MCIRDRDRDLRHACGKRVRHGTDLSRGSAGCRAAGLAAQERSIRIGHEDHRWYSRAPADTGRSLLVTATRRTGKSSFPLLVRRNRSDLQFGLDLSEEDRAAPIAFLKTSQFRSGTRGTANRRPRRDSSRLTSRKCVTTREMRDAYFGNGQERHRQSQFETL